MVFLSLWKKVILCMNVQDTEHYEYDEVSDLLDGYFGEKRAAWTIDINGSYLVELDREARQIMASLSFLEPIAELSRPTPLADRRAVFL